MLPLSATTREFRLSLPLLALLLMNLPAMAQETVAAKLIQLELDATEVARRLLHARLVIPAAPGPLTLLYPKWVPGEHGPSGPIADLAGIRISAGEETVAWRRDPFDMYAIHCIVPDGVEEVEVKVDFLSSPPGGGFTDGASMTPHLAVVNWNQVLLYPQGVHVGECMVQASIVVPAGWELEAALPVASASSSKARFAAVSLETLLDSPLLCGQHTRRIPLGPSDGVPHFLFLASDRPEALEVNADQKRSLDRLIAEAHQLFGGYPYPSHRFLFALSDQVSHFGLEHHASSDNRAPERTLVDGSVFKWWIPVLPHELVPVRGTVVMRTTSG